MRRQQNAASIACTLKDTLTRFRGLVSIEAERAVPVGVIDLDRVMNDVANKEPFPIIIA